MLCFYFAENPDANPAPAVAILMHHRRCSWCFTLERMKYYNRQRKSLPEAAVLRRNPIIAHRRCHVGLDEWSAAKSLEAADSNEMPRFKLIVAITRRLGMFFWSVRWGILWLSEVFECTEIWLNPRCNRCTFVYLQTNQYSSNKDRNRAYPDLRYWVDYVGN